MGTFGIPALLAPALGPTLGGYLVTYAGWQAIFYINLPIGILAVILVALFIREAPIHAGLRFDAIGFVLAALGLAMVLYGLSDATTAGWGSTKILSLLIGGVLVLALFIVAELLIISREGQPLLDLRLFSNGPFRTSIIANVFVIFSLFGGVFLFPIYLQSVRGLSAFQAGLLLLPQALASMVSVLVGGRLVDRIGARAVMIPGLILLGIATWQLSFITIYSPFWWIQLMLIIRGLGLGLCIQPLTVVGLSEVSPRQLAQASSLNTVTRSVSSSLGIAVLATLVQTQAKVHFVHLAEQVTSASPLGQMIAGLQAAFVARGADIMQAQAAAIQVIVGLVQRQAFILALQDAFTFSLVVVVLAIVAVLFVRQTRRRVPPVAAGQQGPLSQQEAEEMESSRLVLIE
jgi:DHA2 family multidrug resistance protein